jgi:hypothetical protein
VRVSLELAGSKVPPVLLLDFVMRVNQRVGFASIEL